MPQHDWTPEARRLLEELEEPRRPDQLERAIKKRRMVRGLLRALSLMDRIEVVPPIRARVEKLRDAEMKCKMGVVHLRKREFARARELFRVAHENDPSAGLYQAYLAYSMFADPSQRGPETIEKSHEMLMEALDKDKEEAVIHLYLGYVLKAKDRPRDALHHFKKVLRLLPYHADAWSEVRGLQRRLER